tara:strand:- start:397 stop:894 length:498 start_codon:yes stop_codon:yes gene_type:complete
VKRKITSNKSIFFLLILLFICSVCFQNLPNEIYPNMLDLLFGFNALDVQKTFETLGETGRIQYVYSSLILDTVFPVLYVLLFISILLKLNERRIFILCIPILAGIFDLGENISISLMMSSNSFREIPESQIFISSILNQCKWSLCLFSIIFIFFKLISNSLKKEA